MVEITPSFRVELEEIYEVLITTLSPEKHYNVAPMGVIFRSDQEIELRIFNTSNTCRNLQHVGKARINFVNDLFLFYKAALDKQHFPETALSWKSPDLPPGIKNAWLILDVQVHAIKKQREMTHFVLKIISKQEKIIRTAPFCRSHYKLLETIIHLTRLPIFKERDPYEFASLKEAIDENIRYVRAHSRSETALCVLDLILTYLDNF
ncbi:MAG: DUF447 domain-containing protein [Candidatus Helarchaeota archaeon]